MCCSVLFCAAEEEIDLTGKATEPPETSFIHCVSPPSAGFRMLSEKSELNYRHAAPDDDCKPQRIREQRGPPLESRSTCADDQWFRQRVRERQALLSLDEASGGVWLLGTVAYMD